MRGRRAHTRRMGEHVGVERTSGSPPDAVVSSAGQREDALVELAEQMVDLRPHKVVDVPSEHLVEVVEQVDRAPGVVGRAPVVVDDGRDRLAPAS